MNIVYKCNTCEFFTNLKYNYNRHLKTKKHLKKIENKKNNAVEEKKVEKDSYKVHIFNTKGVNFSGEKTKRSNLICDFCDKKFSTIYSLKRHTKKYCENFNTKNLEKNEENEEIFKNPNLEKLNLMGIKEEIQKLEVKIDNLNEKNKFENININKNNNFSNNTNSNNQTNNIQINLFKNEDLTCLTDKFLDKVVSCAFGIGELMTKKIYFNDKFPQNKTIKMVNRKDELIKIKTEEGFKFIDKNEIYNHIIDNNDFILEEHFNGNKEKFSEYKKNTYENLRKLMNEENPELLKKIRNDIKMVLWNNME